MNRKITYVGLLWAFASLSFAGLGTWGCSSTTTSSAGGGTTGGSTGGSTSSTVTVTGAVAISASDAALRLHNSQSALSSIHKPKFQTVGDTVLADADVTLVKITSDGTETDVATTTTNALGEYSFSTVPVAVGGTGESTDFYYEVRVTDGDVSLSAPLAPSADAEVNVSPESNLAAKIISDVADVPGQTSNPVPTPDTIETVRELTIKNVDALADDIEIPSVAATAESDVIATANGISAAGGDAERMYKAYQFQSEFTAINADESSSTTDDVAGYMKRMTREGCGQDSSNNPLPVLAAEAMGEALIQGATFTPTEICAAYNSVATDITCADKVTQFAEVLNEIETNAASDTVTDTLSDSDQIALYVKRDLESTSFTASTNLDADQAVAFLETLPSTNLVPALRSSLAQTVGGGDTNLCNFGNSVNPNDIISSLLTTKGLEVETPIDNPAIAEVVIYNDSGFGCTGDGRGHFIGNVDVYVPTGDARSITSVVITSSDSTALGGDGTITLTQNGPAGHYVSQVDANVTPTPPDCVATSSSANYTVTATLSDSSTVTDVVNRTHPVVPEAVTTIDGASLSRDQTNPTVTTVSRPTFAWTSPTTALASIADAPEGSAIKYTYEFSHILVGAGSPISSSTACPSVTSDGQLYAVDNFIPTVDCNVDACATAQGVDASQVVCRMNIQTYLVDQYDNLLGQAAGNFTNFCVDTNSDGDCGN